MNDVQYFYLNILGNKRLQEMMGRCGHTLFLNVLMHTPE